MRKIQSKSYTNLSKFAVGSYSYLIDKHITIVGRDIAQFYDFVMGHKRKEDRMLARHRLAVNNIATGNKYQPTSETMLSDHEQQLIYAKEWIQKISLETDKLNEFKYQHLNFDPKALQSKSWQIQDINSMINNLLEVASEISKFIQEKMSDRTAQLELEVGDSPFNRDENRAFALRRYARHYPSIVKGLQELKDKWEKFTAATKDYWANFTAELKAKGSNIPSDDELRMLYY